MKKQKTHGRNLSMYREDSSHHLQRQQQQQQETLPERSWAPISLILLSIYPLSPVSLFLFFSLSSFIQTCHSLCSAHNTNVSMLITGYIYFHFFLNSPLSKNLYTFILSGTELYPFFNVFSTVTCSFELLIFTLCYCFLLLFVHSSVMPSLLCIAQVDS